MSSRVETQCAQVRGTLAVHTSSHSLKTNPASAIWPRSRGQLLKVEPSESSLPSRRIKEECTVKHTVRLHASVSTSVEWAMSPLSDKERGRRQCLRGSGPWHTTPGLPLPLQVQCPLLHAPVKVPHIEMASRAQSSLCLLHLPTPGTSSHTQCV